MMIRRHLKTVEDGSNPSCIGLLMVVHWASLLTTIYIMLLSRKRQWRHLSARVSTSENEKVGQMGKKAGKRERTPAQGEMHSNEPSSMFGHHQSAELNRLVCLVTTRVRNWYCSTSCRHYTE